MLNVSKGISKWTDSSNPEDGEMIPLQVIKKADVPSPEEEQLIPLILKMLNKNHGPNPHEHYEYMYMQGAVLLDTDFTPRKTRELYDFFNSKGIACKTDIRPTGAPAFSYCIQFGMNKYSLVEKLKKIFPIAMQKYNNDLTKKHQFSDYVNSLISGEVKSNNAVLRAAGEPIAVDTAESVYSDLTFTIYNLYRDYICWISDSESVSGSLISFTAAELLMQLKIINAYYFSSILHQQGLSRTETEEIHLDKVPLEFLVTEDDSKNCINSINIIIDHWFNSLDKNFRAEADLASSVYLNSYQARFYNLMRSPSERNQRFKAFKYEASRKALYAVDLSQVTAEVADVLIDDKEKPHEGMGTAICATLKCLMYSRYEDDNSFLDAHKNEGSSHLGDVNVLLDCRISGRWTGRK